jgi:hypothetical protein
MKALSYLNEDLEILDKAIGAVSAKDLKDDAVLAVILKPVREELKSADTRISTAEDIAKVWPEIRRDYGRNSKLVRLGHRISRSRRLAEDRLQRWGQPQRVSSNP